MSSFEGILSNTSWLLIDRFIKITSGLIITWLASRTLDINELGIWFSLLLVTGLLEVICRLGFEHNLITLCSKYTRQANNLLLTSIYFSFAITLLIFTIIYFLVDYLENGHYLLILSIYLLPNVILNTEWFFVARGQSDVIGKVSIISSVIGVSLKVVLLIKFVSIYSLILSHLIQVFIHNALLLTVYLRSDRRKKRKSYNYSLIAVKSLSLKIKNSFLISILSISYQKIDQLIVLAVLEPKSLAIYGIAAKFYEASLMIPFIVANVSTKNLTRIFKNDLEYTRVLKRLIKLTIIIPILGIIILFVYGSNIFKFIFGDEFIQASDVLSIMLIGSIFLVIASFSNKHFILIEKYHYIHTRLLVSCVTLVVFGIILVPKYQIVGAAYSTVISSFLSSYLFLKLLGNRIGSFQKVLKW